MRSRKLSKSCTILQPIQGGMKRKEEEEWMGREGRTGMEGKEG